jgi:phage protein D/phage baseplate assembly protein gpV
VVLTAERGTARIHIELEGRAIEEGLAASMLSATVESAARLPDVAELRFHDLALRYSTARVFALGQVLRISFGDNDGRKDLFAGEVTAVELELDAQSDSTLIVTALDRAHRLHRGRQTRVFQQLTDSDIAVQIARDLSLRAEVETTSKIHDYILQDNLTDWEFLARRAASVGFELLVHDETLYFKPPPARPSDDITLAWEGDLTSLSARMTAFEQIDDVQVRAWNAVDKECVVGTADRPNLLAQLPDNGRPGGAVARDAYNRGARVTVTSGNARTEAEAEQIAQAVLDDAANGFLSLEGRAVGNPSLRAGCGIVLNSVGPEFSGRYVATTVRHTYDARGYRSQFRAGGHRANDLLTMLAPVSETRMRLFPGVVTDNRDERDVGRVKVKLPLLGDAIESDWCRVVAPGAGKQRGVQFLPEVDDEVLVLGGGEGPLYVLGGVWSAPDRPPLPIDDALSGRQTRRRVIRSRAGHRIEIDDEDGGGGIEVVSADGATRVQLDAGGRSVEIAADVIKLKAKQELSLECDGNATVRARDLGLKAAKISAGM